MVLLWLVVQLHRIDCDSWNACQKQVISSFPGLILSGLDVMATALNLEIYTQVIDAKKMRAVNSMPRL